MIVGRVETSRIRLLAIERMFASKIPLNSEKILRKLDLEYDIQANRKTIYADIAALNRFMNIVSVGEGRGHYWQYIDMKELLKDD